MMSTVSPKTADPALRSALIETAARLIAEEGSAGLSLRRLANEVSTSTMAIYTHFGSMDEVRGAVRREGFARLATHLSAVEETGDTVADLTLLGLAYYANAVTNPNLYRAMFMEHPAAVSHVGVGIETFVVLVSGVERCIRAGRFTPADPAELATQVWSMEHGIVALHLAGFLSADQALATFTATGGHLMRAFGDDPAALGRSFATARRRARLTGAVAGPSSRSE
jgi:AcrR family transcriptional regulator